MINVDDWPNRRNKAVFSNFSGIVWALSWYRTALGLGDSYGYLGISFIVGMFLFVLSAILVVSILIIFLNSVEAMIELMKSYLIARVFIIEYKV